jgi:hypothetical protein
MGLVDSGAMVRLEGLGSLKRKKLMAQSEVEPAT